MNGPCFKKLYNPFFNKCRNYERNVIQYCNFFKKGFSCESSSSQGKMQRYVRNRKENVVNRYGERQILDSKPSIEIAPNSKEK